MTRFFSPIKRITSCKYTEVCALRSSNLTARKRLGQRKDASSDCGNVCAVYRLHICGINMQCAHTACHKHSCVFVCESGVHVCGVITARAC